MSKVAISATTLVVVAGLFFLFTIIGPFLPVLGWGP